MVKVCFTIYLAPLQPGERGGPGEEPQGARQGADQAARGAGQGHQGGGCTS